MTAQLEEMAKEDLPQLDIVSSPTSPAAISGIKLQPFEQQPTNENTDERLRKIDELKYFLCTATNDWDSAHTVLTFPLPSGENISCVLWNELFHITGTDIVRCLLYRFHLFGRPVTNLKKFEEGIFSDLRNLKPGMDASLEEPKSEFLEMLYKNNCIRTQKKQKVFYWFSVPHDRLFLDALERDLKKEKIGSEPTSIAIAEPATSLTLDSSQDLFDQVRKSMSLSAVAVAQAMDENLLELHKISNNTIATTSTTITDPNKSFNSNISLTTAPADNDSPVSMQPVQFPGAWSSSTASYKPNHRASRSMSSISVMSNASYFDRTSKLSSSSSLGELSCLVSNPEEQQSLSAEQHKLFGAFALFEGSPTYKQRQRRRTFSCFPLLSAEGVCSDGNAPVDPQQLFLLLQKQQLLQQQTRLTHDNSMICSASEEKMYTCPLTQCARTFKRLEHLKRHFRTHTLERPYSCDMCGKQFSRTDNLAQHKKTHNRKYSFTATGKTNNGQIRAKRVSSPDIGSTTPVSTAKHVTSPALSVDSTSNLFSANNTTYYSEYIANNMTPESSQPQYPMSAEATTLMFYDSNNAAANDFPYTFDNAISSYGSSSSPPLLPVVEDSTVHSSPASMPTFLDTTTFYNPKLAIDGLQSYPPYQLKPMSADIGKPLPLIFCEYEYCNTAIFNNMQ